MTMRWIVLGAVMGMFAVGCDKADGGGDGDGGGGAGDDAAQSCIESNLPEDGHGFESDDETCAAPPPGEPDPGCPPVTPEDIAEECAEDGEPCDAGAFITRDAALCIAEAEGLAEGIAKWRANLVYNYTFRRPVWAVQNTTLDDPANCEKEGEGVMMDAETGEVLDRYGWNQIC